MNFVSDAFPACDLSGAPDPRGIPEELRVRIIKIIELHLKSYLLLPSSFFAEGGVSIGSVG